MDLDKLINEEALFKPGYQLDISCEDAKRAFNESNKDSRSIGPKFLARALMHFGHCDQPECKKIMDQLNQNAKERK